MKKEFEGTVYKAVPAEIEGTCIGCCVLGSSKRCNVERFKSPLCIALCGENETSNDYTWVTTTEGEL